jgi:hypothetical protein
VRWIEGRIEREEMLEAALDRVWSVVSSVERLTRIFPDLESSRSEGDRTIWVLREQHGVGVTIRPRTTLRIRFEDESRIRIHVVLEMRHGGGREQLAEEEHREPRRALPDHRRIVHGGISEKECLSHLDFAEATAKSPSRPAWETTAEVAFAWIPSPDWAAAHDGLVIAAPSR